MCKPEKISPWSIAPVLCVAGVLFVVGCGDSSGTGDNNVNGNWNTSDNNNNGGTNANYNYNYNTNFNSSGGCENLDCGAHGTCVEDGGVARCECDLGYTGTFCNLCALGYHLDGVECVSDTDVYFGTPTVDGDVTEGTGDWTADQHVGADTTASDWGTNVLTDLYVAYDANNLYIGVVGFVESANSLVVYLDTDYGPTSVGLPSIAGATDNTGALDNSVSALISVTDTDWQADWAVGTKGMAAIQGGMSDDAGWRNIGLDGTNFPWVVGDVVAGTSGFEAAIPLTSLFGGVPAAGTTIALFARLVNEDGQFLANQTVPSDNPADPGAVSQVITITMGGAPGTCNNDGDCDAGETYVSCPSDCPPPSLCGDSAVFQWEDAVMYFAMVDRFYDSDGSRDSVAGVDFEADYQGGDWVGVEQKMTYLQNLGVNTLWLSAPYENRNTAGAAIDPAIDSHMYSAYHGYWPSPGDIDYSNPASPVPTPQVESRLGTSQDLHSLIGTAHAGGLYVLFDYVMNHVDADSDLYGANDTWFATDTNNDIVLCAPDNWNDPVWSTKCAFTDYLPPFDFSQPVGRAWSVNDAIWWAKEYGIDGYRLDAIKHVPFDWLTDLRTALNAEFAMPTGGRFYLVGETYDYGNQGVLAAYINPQTMLDGQFDFPLRLQLCTTFFSGSQDLNSLFGWMNTNDTFYPPGALMSTWIGNHDIPRAIHFANGGFGGNCYEGSNVGNGWNPGAYTQPTNAEPYERLGLAFGVMLTNRGVPLIYYGDEIGLAGGGDPDNRRMMQWTGLNTHQQNLRDLVTRLIQIRTDHVTLRRGYRQTVTSGTDTYAYRMTGCGADHDVYVLINKSAASASITGVPAGNFTEQVTETQVTGGAGITVPARSIRILTQILP
jgi:glycosidase